MRKFGRYHRPIAALFVLALAAASVSRWFALPSVGGAAQEGIHALIARVFHKPGDVGNRLGYYLGQIERQALTERVKMRRL